MTDNLFFILGPCGLESESMALHIAAEVARLASDLGVRVYFKASYDKANRTRGDAWRGPGLEEGLRILEKVRQESGLPILTDVHSPAEARAAGKVVDVLQVPAFLCRQTDSLQAAGSTGLPVNIKKGQFLHPNDMKWVAEKVLGPAESSGESTGTGEGSGTEKHTREVWLCERGTSFGHGDLVVDPRSLVMLQNTARELGELDAVGRVVFDATHSAQQRAGGGQTGGHRRFVRPLARAAIAIGVDGIFAETHPDPDNAKSDAATQWPLAELRAWVTEMVRIRRAF